MADLPDRTDFENLAADAEDFASFVNGEIGQRVTTRSGKELRSLSDVSHYGVGFTAFTTKAAMLADTTHTGFARVGNDGANNGSYYRAATTDSWVKSSDPDIADEVTRAKAAEATKAEFVTPLGGTFRNAVRGFYSRSTTVMPPHGVGTAGHTERCEFVENSYTKSAYGEPNTMRMYSSADTTAGEYTPQGRLVITRDDLATSFGIVPGDTTKVDITFSVTKEGNLNQDPSTASFYMGLRYADAGGDTSTVLAYADVYWTSTANITGGSIAAGNTTWNGVVTRTVISDSHVAGVKFSNVAIPETFNGKHFTAIIFQPCGHAVGAGQSHIDVCLPAVVPAGTLQTPKVYLNDEDNHIYANTKQIQKHDDRLRTYGVVCEMLDPAYGKPIFVSTATSAHLKRFKRLILQNTSATKLYAIDVFRYHTTGNNLNINIYEMDDSAGTNIRLVSVVNLADVTYTSASTPVVVNATKTGGTNVFGFAIIDFSDNPAFINFAPPTNYVDAGILPSYLQTTWSVTIPHQMIVRRAGFSDGGLTIRDENGLWMTPQPNHPKELIAWEIGIDMRVNTTYVNGRMTPSNANYTANVLENAAEGWTWHFAPATGLPEGITDSVIAQFRTGAARYSVVADTVKPGFIGLFTGLYSEIAYNIGYWNSLNDTSTGHVFFTLDRAPTVETNVYRACCASVAGEAVLFQKGRGTLAVPTATLSGDQVYAVRAQVYTGSDWGDCAKIRTEAAEAPTSTSSPGRWVFSTTPSGSKTLSDRWRIQPNGTLEPCADGTLSFGSASFRPAQLFAATATVNTSGADTKTNVSTLSTAEMAVARKLADLVRRYQFCDAVASKGESGARYHFGLIYEDVEKVFASEGLDGHRYGILCEDPAFVQIERKVTVQRQVTEEVEEVDPKPVIEIVDGRAIERTVVRTVTRAKYTHTDHLVFDQAGNPVMQPKVHYSTGDDGKEIKVYEYEPVLQNDGTPELDADGKPVMRMVMEQKTYTEGVPVMETCEEVVSETVPDLDENGAQKTVKGLRYTELWPLIIAGMARG